MHIVPPVAAAVMNLKIQKSQNHGAKAAKVPATNCRTIAAKNGGRRPFLEKDIGETSSRAILPNYILIRPDTKAEIPNEHAQHEYGLR